MSKIDQIVRLLEHLFPVDESGQNKGYEIAYQNLFRNRVYVWNSDRESARMKMLYEFLNTLGIVYDSITQEGYYTIDLHMIGID